MNQQSVFQFRLEPGGFRRHNFVHIRDGEKVFHRCREHRKRQLRPAFVNEFFEFRRAACAADKADSRIRARVVNTQNRREQCGAEHHLQCSLSGVRSDATGRGANSGSDEGSQHGPRHRDPRGSAGPPAVKTVCHYRTAGRIGCLPVFAFCRSDYGHRHQHGWWLDCDVAALKLKILRTKVFQGQG